MNKYVKWGLVGAGGLGAGIAGYSLGQAANSSPRDASMLNDAEYSVILSNPVSRDLFDDLVKEEDRLTQSMAKIRMQSEALLPYQEIPEGLKELEQLAKRHKEYEAQLSMNQIQQAYLITEAQNG